MSHYLDRQEAATALRAAADLIDTLPDVPRWWVACEAYGLTASQIAEAACLPGTWGKDANDAIFELSQGIVELHANREEVCEAVPTGRKTTVKKIATPAVYEDVEVDEVEWKCVPLLSKAES